MSWGIVWRVVDEPSFDTREIAEVPFKDPLIPSAVMDLARWMAGYYLCPAGTVIRHFLPGDGKTVLALMGVGRKRNLKLRPPSAVPLAVPLTLNPAQRNAADALGAAVREKEFSATLLRGVTGSGKTAVFLEAARAALADGRSVLYLVPEIALTPQTTERVRAGLGCPVALFHSGLSLGERAQAWLDVRQGRTKVAVGARSALFAPLSDPGLIIVDEEHDSSYKQDEAPRFQARDAAVWLARRQRCPVVLASATPSLESWKNAQEGRYRLLELTERACGQSLPEVKIIDRRTDPAPGVLTVEAREALRETIGRGERALVLLNRRGWSPSMECRSCGYVPECPDCPGLRMVLHRREGQLVCHHCGRMIPVPVRCPVCGSDTLDADGIAIQRLEEELTVLLPGTPVIRLDRDVTAGRRDELPGRLAAFREHGGVLLGTQMIDKGHDFPAVTLVVAADGDVGMGVPDFRAEERSFQTLTQAAGRCGRDRLPGRVLLQTRLPDSPLLAKVRAHDYLGFAGEELAQRRELQLPPWSRMLLVEAAGSVPERAEAVLNALLPPLQKLDVQVMGPVPAPLPVVRGMSRFHLLLKCSGPVPALRPLLARWLAAPGDTGVRKHVDVDPVDLM